MKMAHLKLNNLSFAFPQYPLFSEVNISLPLNGITLLTGANGSGKSTLCRLITGLEKGFSGTINLHDSDLSQKTTVDIASDILYLKQNANLNLLAATPQLDLKLWLDEQANDISSQQISSALDWFELRDLADQPLWELSGGQLQRLALSALVLNQNKFWILDEPAAGLDSLQQNNLIRLIKMHKNFNGALIISHRDALFNDLADKVYKIINKNIEAVK